MGQLKRTKRRVVQEGIPYGVYVWQMPDNNILGDSQGNVLSVVSMRGDIKNMNAIARFVKLELGIEGGTPLFLEGADKLTQDEHDGQMEQMLNGFVPDRDIASYVDDAKRKKRNGN
jgi:hypothetical protein